MQFAQEIPQCTVIAALSIAPVSIALGAFWMTWWCHCIHRPIKCYITCSLMENVNRAIVTQSGHFVYFSPAADVRRQGNTPSFPLIQTQETCVND